MSLLDEARAVRQRIAARLRELEPLVREYEELQQLATEMGMADADSGSSASVSASRPSTSPAAGATTRRSSASGRLGGQREAATAPLAPRAGEVEVADRVLEAVRAEAGKTVAEYGDILGVAPTALYRPVRRLTNDGAIVKRARQLFPGNGGAV